VDTGWVLHAVLAKEEYDESAILFYHADPDVPDDSNPTFMLHHMYHPPQVTFLALFKCGRTLEIMYTSGRPTLLPQCFWRLRDTTREFACRSLAAL